MFSLGMAALRHRAVYHAKHLPTYASCLGGSTLIRSDQFTLRQDVSVHRTQQPRRLQTRIHLQHRIQRIQLEMIMMHPVSTRRRRAAVPRSPPGVFALQCLHRMINLPDRFRPYHSLAPENCNPDRPAHPTGKLGGPSATQPSLTAEGDSRIIVRDTDCARLEAQAIDSARIDFHAPRNLDTARLSVQDDGAIYVDDQRVE